jgi:glutaredoxin-related protein
MYLLFTMPKCPRCDIAKEKLNNKNIEYKEIAVMESKENIALAKKYNIKMAGIVIDDETGKEVKL